MKRLVINLLLVAAAAGSTFAANSATGADRPAKAGGKPLRVFILAGQSNMQGHAHVRTIDAMELNPTTAPILKEMRNADGSPRVCERVWISSLGSADEERVGKLSIGFGSEPGGPKIGPEFTFGIYMQKALDGPILIIKTAWGGKSLHTDFRPPSAGPYRFSESQLDALKAKGKDVDAITAERTKASGHYYRLMIEHVKHVLADIRRVYPEYDPQQGYRLAGFVWLQGWNDMVASDVYPERDRPGGYDEYGRLLAQFIRDVRRDLATPKLPFVIGVMGVGGPTKLYGGDQLRYKNTHQNFRDAMAAPAQLPEFQGNVAAVLTEKYWDLEATALREREKALKPKLDAINLAVKEKKMTREEAEAARKKLDAENFTPRELVILRESVSNAEFHYLGSARIMTQIGKGFAEAMVELGVK
jgi:alpha-galactosidase